MYDKIRSLHYETKLPYARKNKDRAAYDAYKADQNRLEDEFRRDALAHVGLTGHPKADKAYAYAWEEGHASGFHEVLVYLERIAEVILD